MGWRVWGDKLLTGELGASGREQPVIFNKNVILLAVRTWVIVNNDPSFTSINMKIYSDDSSSRGKLLHTSDNSVTKSELITSTNGVKEAYFEFDAPTGVPLKGTTTYRFALDGAGYTGSSSSHLAWRIGFPDPVYQNNITVSFNDLLQMPYTMVFVGAEL